MPKLCSIDGVDLFMYFRDHAPPHVHAFYGGTQVLITLNDGSIKVGLLPLKKLQKIQLYLAEHRSELLTKWATFGGG